MHEHLSFVVAGAAGVSRVRVEYQRAIKARFCIKKINGILLTNLFSLSFLDDFKKPWIPTLAAIAAIGSVFGLGYKTGSFISHIDHKLEVIKLNQEWYQKVQVEVEKRKKIENTIFINSIGNLHEVSTDFKTKEKQ